MWMYIKFHIIFTQKYNPNAKKLNNVPEDKNNEANKPTDNSFVNDLYDLFYVI